MEAFDPELLLAFWDRACDGDVDASIKLLDKSRHCLRLIIRKFLSKRARAFQDSDDMLQETLMALLQQYKAGPCWHTAEEFTSVLMRLAKERAIGATRRAAAVKRGGEDATKAKANTILAPRWRTRLSDQEFLTADVANWLKNHVSLRASWVLDLRMSGFTVSEIAQQLICHERTVQKYVQEIVRAYCKLEGNTGHASPAVSPVG